jgi:hypothetical protein
MLGGGLGSQPAHAELLSNLFRQTKLFQLQRGVEDI